MERLLRLKEIEEIYSITAMTIRRWEKRGLIKTVRTPGGQRRVPESEIRRVLGLVDFPESSDEKSEKCISRSQ